MHSHSDVRQPLVLREWDEACLTGAALSVSDRALVKQLEADQRIVIEELRTGIRVRSSSWVGVVRLSQLEIHITPKLVESPAWLVKMLDYAGAIESLERTVGEHSLKEEGDDLLDLFTLLLCEAAQRLWNGGLLADYVERVDELQVVRGRLLFERQLMERFGQLDRLICRHDERETNILENQLVGAALTVAARRAHSPELRRRAHRLAGLFGEQCTPEELHLEAAREALVYNRLNQHYKAAHGLAWLVLDGMGVRDLHAVGPTDCFAFLLNMNALFEAFVERLVRDLLSPTGVRVVGQAKDKTVLYDLTSSKSYASVIPDLLASGLHGALVPMDAKYKTYENQKANREDLYQAFLYAMAYRADERHKARALILHPISGKAVTVRELAVRNERLGPAAEIWLCALPVSTLLAERKSGGMTINALREQLVRSFTQAPKPAPSAPPPHP